MTCIYPNFEIAIIRKGVTIETVANVIGITPDALYRRLRGEINFKWEEADKLSDYFEMNPKELFQRREEGKT